MVIERSRVAWFAITGLLAAAVAIGLVVSQAGVAFEQRSGAIPGIAPVGELRLEFGAQDRFVYDPADGADLIQSITNSRCLVQLSGAQLVNLSDAGPAGTAGDSMGVYGGSAQGGRGVPCGRISGPTETLVWKLDGSLAAYTAVSAAFDVEMKSNAIAVASLYLDGEPTGVERLGSGSNATPGTPCVGSSDSGPDSGPNDNCRWILDDVIFDEIRFSADAGEFSVEGGADFPNPSVNRSTITLVDVGVLDCNQSGSSFTMADNDAELSVSGTRLENFDGSECVAILYRLDANAPGEAVSFLKDPDAQSAAQYVFDIDWEPEAATLDPPLTSIVFDTDPALGERDVEICTAQPIDANGAPVDGNSPAFAGFAGLDTTVNGTTDLVPGNAYFEYACVLHEEINYLGADQMVVSQRIYVAGDLRFSRF